MISLDSHQLSYGQPEARGAAAPAQALKLSGGDGTNPLSQLVFCPFRGPKGG